VGLINTFCERRDMNKRAIFFRIGSFICGALFGQTLGDVNNDSSIASGVTVGSQDDSIVRKFSKREKK
jgi:hypothetical protein